MKSVNIAVKALMVVILFLLSGTTLQAYSTFDRYYPNEDIGMNLDLSVVASLFGTSRNLRDLEYRLNDPDLRINNLDLDHDGYVDYLRLLEATEDGIHLIVIQAVLGPNLYQDVATIEVDRDYRGHTFVQIVGSSYLYGADYIIEPRYSYTPLIYRHFWRRDYYRPYHSHYRWGHYPEHYRRWRAAPFYHYSRNVRRHINHRNHYKRTHIRRSHQARKMYRNIGRVDHSHHHTRGNTPLYRPRQKEIRNNTYISAKHHQKSRLNKTHRTKFEALSEGRHNSHVTTSHSPVHKSKKYLYDHSRKKHSKVYHSHYPHRMDR